MRSWRDIDRVVKWLTVVAGLVATIGVLQYFIGFNIEAYYKIPGLTANNAFGAVQSRSVLRRVNATAIHPIEFGVVMAAVFPFALHRTIHASKSLRAWLPTLAIGLAIPLSVSRSAVLVIGAAFIVLLIGWPSRFRKRFLMLAPVIVVAARVALPGVVGTIIALFTNLGNDPSISGRTDDYDVIFRVVADNPIVGRGLFTFVPRYYRILDNQLLTTLLELGIVGLLAVFGLFLTSYACARAARRRAAEAEHQHLGLVTSASIAGVLLSYATFDTWSFPMAAGITFLVIGLSGAIWQTSLAEATSIASTGDADSPTASDLPEQPPVAAPALHTGRPAVRSPRAPA